MNKENIDQEWKLGREQIAGGWHVNICAINEMSFIETKYNRLFKK